VRQQERDRRRVREEKRRKEEEDIKGEKRYEHKITVFKRFSRRAVFKQCHSVQNSS
jgi:hypothetical protein